MRSPPPATASTSSRSSRSKMTIPGRKFTSNLRLRCLGNYYDCHVLEENKMASGRTRIYNRSVNSRLLYHLATLEPRARNLGSGHSPLMSTFPSQVSATANSDRQNSINDSVAPSRCSSGETSFSVDGDGDVRRCHFVKDVIGNIYDGTFPDCLKPRLCTAKACGCYIGYIHRKDLPMSQLYGDGLLERIPSGLNSSFRSPDADSFCDRNKVQW